MMKFVDTSQFCPERDKNKTENGIFYNEQKISNGVPYSLLSLSKDRNNEMKISEILPYRISQKSVGGFMVFMENSIKRFI
jgi:hypothetical protein